MPDWYPYIKAARVLGVRPWELFDQSPAWISWALGVEGVEKRADSTRQQNAEKSQQARSQWEQSHR
jgi:hypothetical protein